MDDRLYRSFLPAPHFHKSNIRSSCLRSGSLSLSWKGAHIQHSASFSRARRFISANPVIECASTTQFLDLFSWVVVAGGVEPPFLAGVAALTRHSPCPPYTPAVSTRCRWRNSDWTCGTFFFMKKNIFQKPLYPLTGFLWVITGRGAERPHGSFA